MKISPTFIVLLIEFAAVLSVLVGIAAFFMFRRGRVMNVALKIAKKKKVDAEPARKEELYTALREVLSGEDDAIRQKAEQIMESERVFHDRVIQAFRTRDKEAVEKLDDWTEDLVSPYRSLIGEATSAGGEVKEVSEINEKLAQMEGTVEALTMERDRVKEELKNKEKEIESMVGEYVSAFKDEGLSEPAQQNNASDVDDDPGNDTQQIAPRQSSAEVTAVASHGGATEAASAADENSGEEAQQSEVDRLLDDGGDLDEEIDAFLEATEAADEATAGDGEEASAKKATADAATTDDLKTEVGEAKGLGSDEKSGKG